MKSRDILHHLGADVRPVVVIHHDDLGVTHAQNEAHRHLSPFPTGSLMLPTAWVSEWVGEPAPDLGVHITLTSEWKAPRWRPLSCSPSLQDEHGYFWQTLEAAWTHIQADEAEAEMHAQVDTALAMGIDVTHIDTHMGAVLRPDLAQIYLQLGMEYRLPVFLPAREALEGLPMPDEFRLPLAQLLDANPLPSMQMIDGHSAPPSQRKEWFVKTLEQLRPGLYHIIHHAALPTPEGKTLLDWETRAADYEALSSLEIEKFDCTIRFITYRELRDLYREAGLFD
jgi:Uncharacterized protein conserved in bacteria